MVVTVAVLVVLLGAAIAVVFVRGGSSQTASPTTTVTVSPATTPSSPASAPTTTAAPTTAAPTTTVPPFTYEFLWPFRSAADAAAWQASYREGGHQPWHLDAAQTALSFSSGFLGYAEIDRIVGTEVDARDARVTVGYLNPNGEPAAAAVVHLVRVGTGDDAPWEVVGTDDVLGFTFAQPSYGASVSTPVTAGGSITGVDESIVVLAHQTGVDGTVGETPPLAAGGTSAPWSTSIDVVPVNDAVVVLSASTGGHVAGVERFVVTAVHVMG